MANNYGRDEIWNLDSDLKNWTEIDKEVDAEVGRVRVAQKIFPTKTLIGSLSVFDEDLDRDNMTITERGQKPFINISVGFTLDSKQVQKEGTLHRGQLLARLAAKKVAICEDEVILYGDKRISSPTLTVSNAPGRNKGLLDQANPMSKHDFDLQGKKFKYVDGILHVVSEGRKRLMTDGYPAPYALIVGSKFYAEAEQAKGGSNGQTIAEWLSFQATGGFFSTSALDEDMGLLVSLAGEPVTLYVSQEAKTAFVAEESDGDSYKFRVTERVQFVVRDRSALAALVIRT